MRGWFRRPGIRPPQLLGRSGRGYQEERNREPVRQLREEEAGSQKRVWDQGEVGPKATVDSTRQTGMTRKGCEKNPARMQGSGMVLGRKEEVPSSPHPATETVRGTGT